MDMQIRLPETCSEEILQEGRRILKSKTYFPLPISVHQDGSLLLKAKIRDSFNFVDHPVVDVDATWGAVTWFLCDCPDYLKNRNFCAHCAALVLELADNTPATCSGVMSREEVDTMPDNLEETAPKSAELPYLEEFSYTFCNSRWDLYPGVREPEIPLERFHQAFGRSARAMTLYRRHGKWGGSCHGISVTACMFRQGNEHTSISDFSAVATKPSELQLSDFNKAINMTLHQYVELMHILQFDWDVITETNQTARDPQCLDQLVQKTKAFQQGLGDPVVMGVFKNANYEGGHAIVPFRVEPAGDGEDLLYIYDPNHPMVTRYAYLQKDEQGNYLNWRFPMNDRDTYASQTDGQLTMNTYEVNKRAWDNRGGRKEQNMMNVLPGVAIMNAEGEVLARVTERGVESYCEDVCQIPLLDCVADGSVMLSMPAGVYGVCLEDSAKDELSVQLTGTDLSVEIATPAREVVVQVKDKAVVASVRISQQNIPYSIGILNTVGGEQEEVFLSGMTGAEALHVVQKNGQLYADGLTEKCTLYINEVQQSLDRIGRLQENEAHDEYEEEKIYNALDGKKEDNEG